MFPLIGTLLTGTEAREWMRVGCLELEKEAVFCTGFLKTEALKSFAKYLRVGSSVKILVRWRLDDILAGASDLDAYQFAREKEWTFFLDMDFHGKAFYFPPKGIILGSANLTNAGFSLSEKHNLEVCTIVPDTPENGIFFERLFENSIRMTDALYEQLKLDVELKKNAPTGHLPVWSREILQIISKPTEIQSLLVSECFLSDGRAVTDTGSIKDSDSMHDLSLLGFQSTPWNPSLIGERFRSTKIYKWLVQQLKNNNAELFFGSLTAALHNALLDDPKPYRMEVKKLVSNLYSWILLLGETKTGILIDQPSHSQRMMINPGWE